MHDDPLDEVADSDVAIIGMAGRFPGSRDIEELWQNLQRGADCISRFAPGELEPSPLVPAELHAHPDFVPAGAILGDADRFDHAFFGIAPAEARLMDPQLRVFLECAFAALEDAGHDPAAYAGKIALYAGAGMTPHLLSIIEHLRRSPAALFEAAGTASDRSLAMRVSHLLGLTGESLTVYTACSTGLVAVHMACQSLILRQSDMALAGGVRVSLPERTGYLYQEGMILSPDGACRAFDHRAGGTVVGHGAAVVVLKLLEDALRDRDPVYAVIKGSAINNDGADKVGFNAPSVQGQADVIRQALVYADVDAASIGYVEAHGTGTRLGDPIEIAALTQAFGERARSAERCAIGSIKTNIGHLDTAAGVAGLIKAALALVREEIPPTLHFEQPNPEIDFASGPFFVNTRPLPWPRGATPRRAGVSSFGIGGTNAHAVLEEAPRRAAAPSPRPVELVVLSARTPTALEAMREALAAHVERNPALPLADVAYTLAVGRRAFACRDAVVAGDGAELARRLRTSRPVARAADSDRPRIAFLLPGQGSQHVDMARALYHAEPVFRQHLDECSEILRPWLDRDLRALLHPAPEHADEAARALEEPAVNMPALLAVTYALARQWESFGIAPHAMLGHSTGEYAAACLAGVMSLQTALRALFERGRLMARTAPGHMLSVAMAEDELLAVLDANPLLSLAAVNGRARCVVSGPPEPIAALAERLTARKVPVVRLPVRHGYHSRLVEPVLEELVGVLAPLPLRPPAQPYVSSRTGTWIRAEEATDPAYWAAQMREPVRFAAGLDTLVAEGCTTLVEVGPSQALTALARAHLGSRIRALPSLPQAGSKRADHAALLHALGALWTEGHAPDWQAVYQHEQRQRVCLPAYRFEGARFPAAQPGRAAAAALDAAQRPARRAAMSADTAEIPAHAADPAHATDIPAAGTTAERIAALWAELLGLDAVGVDDDFLEIGGNSLLAAQVLTRLRDLFAAEIALADLFEATTPRALAERIDAGLSASGGRAPRPTLPLVPAPRTGALSVVQERVWTLAQREPDTPALNMPIALRLVGPLDRGRLQRALDVVVHRHESLRTTYRPGPDGCEPVIADAVSVPLQVHELGGMPRPEQEQRVAALAAEEAVRPFDLIAGPVLRATLLALAADEHHLLLTVHHIVSDTASLQILARELARVHEALASDEAAALPALAVQYADFADWQQRSLRHEALSEQLAYWRARLAGMPAELFGPDTPGAAEGLRSAYRAFTIAPRLVKDMLAFGQRHGATPYVVLLAAYSALVGRRTGLSDVVVGTPFGNRGRAELAPLIGYVAHSIALRIDLGGSPSFAELVARVRSTVLEAHEHGDVPFEALAPELGRTRAPGRTRLFDAVFVLHGAMAEEVRGSALAFKLVDADSATQFGATLGNLSLIVRESEDGMRGVLRYNPDRFDAGEAEILARELIALLERALAWPESAVATLSAAGAGPAGKPAAEPGRAELDRVTARIAALAHATPHAPALCHGADVLTHGELWQRAQKVARWLGARSLAPGQVVAVRLDGVVDTAIALLGTWLAGGACLCAPPPAPAHDAGDHAPGVALVLDARACAEALAPGGADAASNTQADAQADVAQALALAPEAPAWVLRAPVATLLGHDDVARFHDRLDELLGTAPGVWLAAGELHDERTGDRAWLELLWALARGFRVIVPAAAPRRAATAHRALAFSLFYFAADEDTLGANDKYQLLLEGARRADRLGLAAVWTPERHFHAFGGMYPSPVVTSAAVAAVTERVGIRSGSVVMPLHHPVRVAEEWSVVDNLSRGRVGVSFASGWNVHDFVLAPGQYARRREVMREGIEQVRRLWRGEEVRMPDGEGGHTAVRIRPRPVQPELPVWITSGGSVATFRLAGELGAGLLTNLMGQRLEDLISKIAAYREAWDAHGHAPGRGHVTLMMHAYLGADLDAVRAEVRDPLLAYLRSSLDVMRGFGASVGMDVQALAAEDLDALIAHGLDRYLHASGLFGTPESCMPLIEQVRQMDVDEVACLIDFGVDSASVLGGLDHLAALMQRCNQGATPALAPAARQTDPVLAVLQAEPVTHLQCSAALARELARHAASLPAPARFLISDDGAPELPALAARTLCPVLVPPRAQPAPAPAPGPRTIAPPRAPAIPLADRGQPLPLSTAQQRIWYRHQLAPDNPADNNPVGLRITGPLDAGALERALNQVIARHEALRTAFPLDASGAPVQRIEPALSVPLPVIDVSTCADPGAEAARHAAAVAREPFALDRLPLVRAALLRLSATEQHLIVVMHHIVSDGWSAGVVLGELSALYRAAVRGQPSPLPALPVQYADYAAWQRRRLHDDDHAAQLAYWREALRTADWVLDLPTDRPRPDVLSPRGGRHPLLIPQDLVARLGAHCRQEGATPFMALVAGMAALLHRYTGQDSIPIGTPTAGRTRPELEGLVGCFINILVLGTDVSGDPSFRALLGRVRKVALDAYAHADAPFEWLVDELQPEHDHRRTPLVQVILILHNTPVPRVELEGLTMTSVPVDTGTAKRDLTIELYSTPEGLSGTLTYSADLFDPRTGARIVASLVHLLRAAADAPDRPLSQLPLPPPEAPH